MAARRGAAWTLLIGAWLLCLYGLTSTAIYLQPIWAPEGLRRFLLFAAGYAAVCVPLIWLAPGRFWQAAAGVAALYAALAVGPIAVVALAVLALACLALGFLITGAIRPEGAVLGLAVMVGAVMFLAAWPVHYRALYWIAAAALAGLGIRQLRLTPRAPAWQPGRMESACLAALAFPLACHFLVSLQPETSTDGLAMHAVIASRMAWRHLWQFDPTEFAWAVMPMGGDWAWSIAWQLGGEACARLLNVSVLGAIAWMLYRWLKQRLPVWIAAGVAAAWLATPLVQLVTGSLFVENVVAVLLLAAWRLLGEEDARCLLAGCFLCGLAMASKFGALAFAVPLLVFSLPYRNKRLAAAGLALALAVGSVPYLNAWWRTGNPLFPFFNAHFRSPFFPLENFRDARFDSRPGWSALYDLTFHSSRFLEGQDGSAGVFLFLVLPAGLVLAFRRRPGRSGVALATGLAGAILTLAGQANLRYLYAAMPLCLAGLGAAPEEFASGGSVGAAIGVSAWAAFVLNLSLLPAASWYHKDFVRNLALQPSIRTAALERGAPERPLVWWLNEHAPGARAAWLEGNSIGDFQGRPFTNSWHCQAFQQRLRNARSEDDMAALMRELRIQYVLVPAPEGPRPITNVHTDAFCARYTIPVRQFGGMELRLVEAGSAAAPLGAPPAAAPGGHDELSSSTRFRGAWTRDLQFQQAFRGTLVYTNDPSAWAEIRFEGKTIRLIYTAAANRCRAAVFLDGTPAGGFDQHSSETRWQSESPGFPAPASGIHTLRLSFAAPAAAGCYLDLDGFRVE